MRRKESKNRSVALEASQAVVDSLVINGSSCSMYDDVRLSTQAANSLMVWNDNRTRNLLIDRFDVRGLLSSYDAFCKRKIPQRHAQEVADPDVDQNELQYERYQDMFGDNHSKTANACDDDSVTSSDQYTNNPSGKVYSNIHFDYKSPREELWTKPQREEYFVSNYLILSGSDISLPMTKKQYDVMLHTAKNVRESKNSQLEFILKVKHSDDWLFDFLNADSELFPLYKLLKSLNEETFWQVFLGRMKSAADTAAASDKSTLKVSTNASSLASSGINSSSSNNRISGSGSNNALQLLGSMYDDSSDDDDDKNDDGGKKENEVETVDVNSTATAVETVLNDTKQDDAENDVVSSVSISTLAGDSNSSNLKAQTNCGSVAATAVVAEKKGTQTDADSSNSSTVGDEGPVTAANIAQRLDGPAPYRDRIADEATAAPYHTQSSSSLSCITPPTATYTCLPEVPNDSDFSDDQLDEDCDEREAWGETHLEKARRAGIIVRAQRLKRAKELREHFAASAAAATANANATAMTLAALSVPVEAEAATAIPAVTSADSMTKTIDVDAATKPAFRRPASASAVAVPAAKPSASMAFTLAGTVTTVLSVSSAPSSSAEIPTPTSPTSGCTNEGGIAADIARALAHAKAIAAGSQPTASAAETPISNVEHVGADVAATSVVPPSVRTCASADVLTVIRSSDRTRSGSGSRRRNYESRSRSRSSGRRRGRYEERDRRRRRDSRDRSRSLSCSRSWERSSSRRSSHRGHDDSRDRYRRRGRTDSRDRNDRSSSRSRRSRDNN